MYNVNGSSVPWFYHDDLCLYYLYYTYILFFITLFTSITLYVTGSISVRHIVA
jgi:hypothetical protein